MISLWHNTSKLILILVLLCLCQPCFANNKEYALKAGFLFNFARFGQWQSHNPSDEYFTLCSPDKNFIDIANTVVAGKTVHSHILKSKHTPLNTANFSDCEMLFITNNTFENWQTTAHQEPLNMMLVGENTDFIKNGGHIRFFLSGGKVRFEISPERLKNSGLTMSSKVLRLARLVDK
ncbi:YfiR family protein [Pseudoalteromonas sp. MMG010]|uniref:YfiR family protein n=1 Tax=Pseudoalteromonas sp. MMG010 TaxID=2822685 RepID=UPI001B39DACB|nr:YfiR family protein [Pseudoalteromonas sp. MMG010]MBQ4833525.1 YfiR family protein [Pseudoalteromonas sp. MMG010]